VNEDYDWKKGTVYDGTNVYEIAEAVKKWLLGFLGQEWLEKDIIEIRESLNRKGIDQS